MTGFLLACVGIAWPVALGTDLIVGSAPPEKAGSAAAMSETSGEFGIALGVAVLGSVGTAVYRSRDRGPGRPCRTRRPRPATESITGAAAAAQQLPAPLDAELLDAAREAFTAGLNAAAGLASIACLGLAALALIVLRRADTDEASDEALPVREPTSR